MMLTDDGASPVTFALENGAALLNGEPVPIKGITEADLQGFQEELAHLPSDDPKAHAALADAVRAAFIAQLLSHAVGDECVDALTQVLGRVHDRVINYLEE